MKKMFKKHGLDEAHYTGMEWLSAGLLFIGLSLASLAAVCYQSIQSVLSVYGLPDGEAAYWHLTRVQQNVPGVSVLLIYFLLWWGGRDLAKSRGNLWLVALNAAAVRVAGSALLIAVCANILIGHGLMQQGRLLDGQGTWDWCVSILLHYEVWQNVSLLILGVFSLIQVLMPDTMRPSDQATRSGVLKAHPQPRDKSKTTGQHGSAQQADLAYLKSQDMLLTRNQAKLGIGHVIGRAGNRMIALPNLDRWRHTLVVAPPRSGKGVSIVIPRILDAEETVFVLDVKSELFQATYEDSLLKGKKPYAIDPFNELAQYGKKFAAHQILHYDPLNPIGMDLSDTKRKNKYIRALAGGLSEFSGLAHFDEAAKTILMAVLNSYLGTGKTLVDIYKDYASKDRNDTIEELKRLCKDYDSLQAEGAAGLLEKVGDQEAGSMLSTFFRIFQDFADESLQKFFSASQWDINEFLEGQADFYWIQSSSMLDGYSCEREHLLSFSVNT